LRGPIAGDTLSTGEWSVALINSIEVKGFRSLADVTLELGGLTVLIGRNNTGKTNLLDVLKFLSEAAQGKLSDAVQKRGGMRSLLFSRPDGTRGQELSIEVGFVGVSCDVGPLKNGKPWRYSFSLREQRETYAIAREEVAGVDLRGELKRRAAESAGVAVISLPPEAVGPAPAAAYDAAELAVSQRQCLPENSPGQWGAWAAGPWARRCVVYGYPILETGPEAAVRKPQVLRPETLVSPDGSNLASVLYTLQSAGEHAAAYNDMCATLSAAFPEFEELRFPPEGGDGRILLRWREKGQKVGHSSFDLSDGTLSFLFLAALATAPGAPNPPFVFCIDEPEVGLHPHAIRLVAEMLQAAAERTQLVVATHSPILVDGLKPEQVVIVEKGEDPATQFRTLDQEDLKEWLKEFSLGELWLTGHLGSRAWGRSPFTWRATLTRRFFGGCFTISPQP
jgi:predicted ATPase